MKALEARLDAGETGVLKEYGEVQTAFEHLGGYDLEINKWMIEEGCAWHDRRTGPAPHYSAAEKKAREAKLGLWADPTAVNPMNFRRARQQKRQ